MKKPTGKLAFAYQSIANLEAQVSRLRAENEALREIVEAVAHIGVEFGYGAFELGSEHIDKARALIESQAAKDSE